MTEGEENTNEKEKPKLKYAEIAILWWLHPINIAVYLIVFTFGLLATGAFSYAVSLERSAVRMVMGDDMAIAHKTTLFRGYGYRIVRERDTPGEKYSPGEILINLESRQRVHKVREGERFERASRVGAVKAKADRYSDRDQYTERVVEHLHDTGLAKANESALDLGGGVNLDWENQVDYED